VIIGTSIATIGAIAAYYLISYMSNNPVFSDSISVGIQAALVLAALYISYRAIKHYMNSKKDGGKIAGILTKIFNSIRDAFIEIYTTFKEAPSYVYKILLAQAIFVGLWFLVPYLNRLISTYGSVILLDKPIYINKVKLLAKYSDLNKQADSEHNFSYRYGLSAWIYIDNQGANRDSKTNEYLSILNYGFRPDIVYNRSLNTLRVLVRQGKNNNSVVYESKNIQLQKWNHFVVNYDSGTVDIFLNGKLVASKNDIIPYMKRDTLESGTKDGVSGGICNVLYYDEPLSKLKIDWIYDKYKNETTPTI
jgi:hypothetical protein